jgi:streptomycin 6-kinase
VPALPDRFVRTVLDLGGGEGRDWLDRLPATLAGCERRWRIRVGTPYDLSYNYVARAVRDDGTPVVVKVCPPGDPDWRYEAQALRLAAGRGMVLLLDADMAERATLLERAEPARPLTDLARQDDAAATHEAATVMRRLAQPALAGPRFPTVARWDEGFGRHRRRCGGTSGPLPGALFDRAERVYAELCASMAQPVLLHGDLHHDNILSAQREPWLAIDPKGVEGEAVYEAGALLRNPWPDLLTWPDPRRILARRVDQLAEALGADRERVRAWGFAQAMLSAVWTVEDHGEGWDFPVTCAELLG